MGTYSINVLAAKPKKADRQTDRQAGRQTDNPLSSFLLLPFLPSVPPSFSSSATRAFTTSHYDQCHWHRHLPRHRTCLGTGIVRKHGQMKADLHAITTARRRSANESGKLGKAVSQRHRRKQTSTRRRRETDSQTGARGRTEQRTRR